MQWTNHDNRNVQSQEQEASKLRSIVIAKSGAYALRDDILIERPFNKNNIETFKTTWNSNKDLLTWVFRSRYNGADIMFQFKDG